LNTVGYSTQLRIGIQGLPKTAKTYSALTFPNPVVVSYDRGLVAHVGRNIIEVPMYDNAWVDSVSKRKSPQYMDIRDNVPVQKDRPFDRRGALLKFLYGDATKLSKEQTLIIDGGTGVQSAFHIAYWCDPSLDKDGKIKPYEEYKQKINYFTEMALCFKALACNVIYICHESQDRNDKGDLNGRIRPLLSGAFQDELQSHFTDWARAHVVEKPANTPDLIKQFKDKWHLDDTEFKYWMDSTDKNHRSIYLWQLYSDSIANCGTSLKNAPKFIPASWESYQRFMRKAI
jgi:hypothetical protein